MLTSLAEDPFNFCKKENEKIQSFVLSGQELTESYLPVKVMLAEDMSSSFVFQDVLCIWKLCLLVSVVF